MTGEHSTRDPRSAALAEAPAVLPPRLAVRSGDRLVLVNVGEIDWIVANDNPIRLMRLTLLSLAVLSLVGCSPKESMKEKPMATPPSLAEPAVLVELAEIKQGLIEELLERSSPLEAEAQVQVLARTQNPAVELFVEEGDKVTRGQVLLRLESDRQQIDCDQAMNQVEKAQIDFDASEKLYRENLISEQAYRDIKHTFNQARLQAERAKRELEYTEVRAPINGTVTRRSVKVGDQVNLGTPLFEIVDFDSIVAVVHVPEQYLPKLKPNMEARLFSSTLGDEAFDGFVKRISPVVDAQAGTIKVVVGVSELGALRPGMWVDVELVLDSKPDALLIPKRSIVYDNDQTYAFKASWDTNGVRIARRQLVEPRNADKIHIEPQSGFQVGDLIVVAGQSGLKDDSPIRAQEQPEVAGQALTVPIAQSTTNAEPAVAKTTDQSVN